MLHKRHIQHEKGKKKRTVSRTLPVLPIEMLARVLILFLLVAEEECRFGFVVRIGFKHFWLEFRFIP